LLLLHSYFFCVIPASLVIQQQEGKESHWALGLLALGVFLNVFQKVHHYWGLICYFWGCCHVTAAETG